MAYFTEAELEARMNLAFSATTDPTSTQIGTFATEISAMFDGLYQQTEGTETPDEWVKQACLSAAEYVVGQHLLGEPVDPEKTIKILRLFRQTLDTQLYYDQEYAYNTGEW